MRTEGNEDGVEIGKCFFEKKEGNLSIVIL
jgi:hypothetical protein